MTEREQRALLIALNASPRLARPWIYRLAEDLSWCGCRTLDDRQAVAADIPPGILKRARAGAERAAEIAAAEEERAAESGGRIVVRGEPDYPVGLLALPLPPPVLAVRGTIAPGLGLAIVGSRRPDPYGLEAADTFAGALAAAGLVVVSGFARGVDAAAHRAALKAEGGVTLAVLGCGLAIAYPRSHRPLADAIAQRGALLSEFPSGTQPMPWNFPLRNRTIAALSSGTLVVRAAPRSGSLITARHALDLGKTVWAVPGSIFDELSLGPNALLRDGATPALHPRDILDELRPERAAEARAAESLPAQALSESRGAAAALPAGFAGTVLAAIPQGAPISAEELALRTGAGVDRVLTTLLELEIEGLVRKRPGFGYAR
jgi:DNA processing protein